MEAEGEKKTQKKHTPQNPKQQQQKKEGVEWGGGGDHTKVITKKSKLAKLEECELHDSHYHYLPPPLSLLLATTALTTTCHYRSHYYYYLPLPLSLLLATTVTTTAAATAAAIPKINECRCAEFTYNEK